LITGWNWRNGIATNTGVSLVMGSNRSLKADVVRKRGWGNEGFSLALTLDPAQNRLEE
jgi:hypothetical protein